MGLLRSANNPQAMLAQLAQTNPQMKQAMNFIQQYGNDPQKAFYAACQQRGINPNDILNALK